MSLEDETKNNQNDFVISKGTSLNELFNKLDVIGAIKRKNEYRKSHGLPLIYDVYVRREDGSWEMKNGVEIDEIDE